MAHWILTTANIVRHRVMIITSVPTSGQKEADLAAWIWHAHKPCLVIWFAFFLISAYRDLDFTLFRICWRFVRSLFIHGLRILLLFQLSFSLCLFVCLFVCLFLVDLFAYCSLATLIWSEAASDMISLLVEIYLVRDQLVTWTWIWLRRHFFFCSIRV